MTGRWVPPGHGREDGGPDEPPDDARYVVVHADAPWPEDWSAHAFGPFDSWAAADQWAHRDQAAGDECYVRAIAIVGPDPDDIRRTAQ